MCVLFAWRRGEKAKGWMRRASIAGGEDSRSMEAGLAHAGVARPQVEGPLGARCYCPTVAPTEGRRQTCGWMPGRPPAHASQLPSDAFFPARVLVRDRCETRLLGFPSCKLLLLRFSILLRGSGHGFHASTGVDPATRQSFLQCLARFQETKLS